MTTLAFDTLSYSERLQKAGASKELADEHAKLIHETVITDLATKEDLTNAISSLEQRLTIRIGGMIVLAVAVMQALAKFT